MEILQGEVDFVARTQVLKSYYSLPYFGYEAEISFNILIPQHDATERNIFVRTNPFKNLSLGFGVKNGVLMGCTHNTSVPVEIVGSPTFKPDEWNKMQVIIGELYTVVFLNDALACVTIIPKEIGTFCDNHYYFGASSGRVSFVGKLKDVKFRSTVDLYQLYKSGIGCDTELKCADSKIVKVHSGLISALWKTWDRFPLNAVKEHILSTFIELLYTGKANKPAMQNFSSTELTAFLQLVNDTKRESLIHTCNHELKSIVTPNSVVQLLKSSFEMNFHPSTQSLLFSVSAKAMKAQQLNLDQLATLDQQILVKLVQMSMTANAIVSDTAVHDQPLKDDTLELLTQHCSKDFTIIVGEELKVNKAIVAANSEYFKALLRQSNMIEAQKNCIELQDDASVATWKALLTFFTTRNLNTISYLNAAELVGKTHQYFQLSEWLLHYWNYLIQKSLNPSTALSIIEQTSSEKIASNAATVLVSTDWPPLNLLQTASPQACKKILIALSPKWESLKAENEKLQQQLNIYLLFMACRKFTEWRGNMIQVNNTSHAPQNDDMLALVEGKNCRHLKWDGKQSGWIQFKFSKPQNFCVTRICGGTGLWEIQYSSDGSTWVTATQFSIEGEWSLAAWNDPGAYKFWRYNLLKNNGYSYYRQYEWYKVEKDRVAINYYSYETSL